MRKGLFSGWNSAAVKPETGRALVVKKEGFLLYENGYEYDGKEFIGRNGAAKVKIWAYA